MNSVQLLRGQLRPALMGLLMAVACVTSVRADDGVALTSIEQVPEGVEVRGKQVAAYTWDDRQGKNLLVLAEQVSVRVVDVTQSGIFLVDGVEEERLPYILGAYCPNILFPFLREAVNDMVTKGSFPQLLLTPINFDAEFEANMQRAQVAAEGQA